MWTAIIQSLPDRLASDGYINLSIVFKDIDTAREVTHGHNLKIAEYGTEKSLKSFVLQELKKFSDYDQVIEGIKGLVGVEFSK